MIAALAGALVLAAQAAGPAEPAAAAPSAAAPAKPDKPKDDSQKVVCKYETTVGSLIPKRLCGTKADWAALSEDGKKATEEVQTRALTRPTADQARGQ
jgi:hypothetical protein